MSLFDHENGIVDDESEVDMLPRGIDEKTYHMVQQKSRCFQLYHMICNVPDFLRSIFLKLPKIKTRTTQNELRSF